MGSEDRFGYEWDKYADMKPEYEGQFLNWIGGMAPPDFRGKRVLDAGCGMGRNAYWALMYDASSLVAFDRDRRSVSRARQNLSGFKNAEVTFMNIYDIPWRSKFDIVFSIGVIHHLEDPRRAVSKLLDAVRPGGTLLLWMYGYDGNERIIRYLNPIRKHVTSRLPVSVVHVLSYFCSVPLWVFLKATGGGRREYFRQLAGFTFPHLHSIVFDQLIPKVANYWKKEEVAALFEELSFKELSVEPPKNKNGWTVICRK